MPDEIGEYQIRDFPSQTHGGGIKKKIDSVGSDNTNKVNEIIPIYTPTTQSKLKSTISINATVPTHQTSTPATTHASTPIKQENNVSTSTQNPVNQSSVPIGKAFSMEAVKQAVKAFAENLAPSVAREVLLNNPIEVRGKEQVTLFVNQPEHENALGQVKGELLAFLQQEFNHAQLQLNFRKPYTDSEKLNFLKTKYEQVNELVNKLGLDLT